MNTFGTLFRLTDFGESHGVAIGGVVDGMPPESQSTLMTYSISSTGASPASLRLQPPETKATKCNFSPASSKENPRAAP